MPQMLALSRPKITSRRTRKMYDLYTTGATLEEVGNRFDLTRERVRQIFNEADLPTRSLAETQALRHKRLLERSDEIIATYRECKDAGEVARRLDIPQAFVKQIIAEHFPKPEEPHRRPRKPSQFKYATEEMLALLREAAATSPEPLKPEEYRRYAEGRHIPDGRSWPSVHTYMSRFGSWRKALRLANLPAGPHGPSKIKPRFSAQDCIDALRNVAQILGETPTMSAYDDFARASDRRFPSSMTITARLGSWYDALASAGL